MTTKHTPGPWTYEYRAGECSEGYIFSGAREIAVVSGDNQGQWRDADDGGEAEFKANARLIAAAPDLLFALKNLLAAKNGDGGTVFNSDEIAREAIAKAEGKS